MKDNERIYAMKVFEKKELTNRVHYASVIIERNTLLQLHFSLLPTYYYSPPFP